MPNSKWNTRLDEHSLKEFHFRLHDPERYQVLCADLHVTPTPRAQDVF